MVLIKIFLLFCFHLFLLVSLVLKLTLFQLVAKAAFLNLNFLIYI